MTRLSGRGSCYVGIYFLLSVLLLMSTTIYVYLYATFNNKAYSVENINKGTLRDIQSRWEQKESWVKMTWGGRSRIVTDDNDHESNKTDVSTSKRNSSIIKSVIRSEWNSPSPQNTRKPINASKHNSVDYKSKLVLTLFTSWNTNVEKYNCHNNTIRNWIHLKPLIQPILFTNEVLLTTEAVQKGWDVLPVRKAGKGVPILKYMYKDAIERYDSPFYAFSNGDILYTHSLIDTLRAVVNSLHIPRYKPIMIIGRRTNVQNVTSEEASSERHVNRTAYFRGKVFTVWGEDYFITSANYPWMEIPEVVIGRRAYDNWLVWNARRQNHITIDATNTLVALHQTTKSGNNEGFQANHSDYNHNLLRRMYRQLHYSSGIMSCAEYYTHFHDGHEIQILKRNLSKSCFPV